MRQRQKGMTLVEILIATAGMVILIFVMVVVFSKVGIFFQRSSVRNELQSQSRTSVETMARFLKQGNPDTVVISTGPVGLPYSQISFKLYDNTLYTYTLAASSTGNLLQMLVGPAGTPKKTVLAQRVKNVTFYYPNSQDQTIMAVSLTLERTLGSQKITVSAAHKNIDMQGSH